MKIGITGYTGKMGTAITKAISKYPDLQISSALVREANESNPIFTTSINELCENSEIIIDFASPEVTTKIIAAALMKKIPVVCGTTGLSDAQFSLITQASTQIPIFYSPNMSLGIALLKGYLKHAAQALPDFDIEIVETHHRNKKDIPSGTALMLASAMTDDKDNIVVRSRGNQNKRRNHEIGIASVRGGHIFSDHEIMFLSENEAIKFSHQAMSNNVYAHGTIKAAIWLKSQKPGLYSMDNLIV